jgi:hypothetical protein
MLKSLLGTQTYEAYFHYIVGIGIIVLGFFVASIVVSIFGKLLDHSAATP